MSNRRKQSELARGNPTWWATAGHNQQVFNMYRDQITQLALSRFKWVGLPKTCDARYLEFVLLTQGCATIAFPKSQPETFYSTQISWSSPPNVYDNPTKWQSIGNNGWRFDVTPARGVVVWDNLLRTPILPWFDVWARDLTDIRKTMQMNRMHQKVPYIIRGPQEKRMDMVNLYKQVAGGEPAVIATNGIESISMEVLKTDVPYLGAELYSALENQWNEVYAGLGIPNLPFKLERQIEDEVKSQNAPSSLMALNPLESRRQAAATLVRKWPQAFPDGLEVVWNRDIVTDNYDMTYDLKLQTDTEETNDETAY